MQVFLLRMAFVSLSTLTQMGWFCDILLSFFSPFVFDRFVKGEGAVVIVLKPVDMAIADNDHIYSVASALTTLRHDYTH